MTVFAVRTIGGSVITVAPGTSTVLTGGRPRNGIDMTEYCLCRGAGVGVGPIANRGGVGLFVRVIVDDNIRLVFRVFVVVVTRSMPDMVLANEHFSYSTQHNDQVNTTIK